MKTIVRHALLAALCTSLPLSFTAALAAELPIFDAHIHYSHDAWEATPPAAPCS